MKKKILILLIFFIILFLLNIFTFIFNNSYNLNLNFNKSYFNIQIFSQTKDWFYEIFSMQKQEETEKKIDARIQNGFFSSGIDFDGINLTIFFTKLFPYNISKINEWKIDSTEPEKDKILSLLKKNIENGFFPINISYSEFLFMVFFIKFNNQPIISSFNLGIYPFNSEKKDESFKLVSKNINEYIKKGYIINGFSLDKNNFYVLFTKTNNKNIRIKNWGIDWVLTQNYSFNNYILDTKMKNRKIIDIKPDEEFLILLWIEE